ncbi:MAG: chemotaxis protein CheW [Ktedonobacteraceae bacterium]
MNTHDSALAAIAASLDVSHVRELAQLNDEAFWNYARTLAGTVLSTHEQPPLKRDEEYLECVSGKGRFLLSLAMLYEIVPPPRRYTDLPGKPVWMSGLAAWHGSAIVVIDLTLYLTGETFPIHEQAPPKSLLIAHTADMTPGLLVHSNGNIISTDDIAPLPFDDALTAGASALYAPARHTVIAGKHADAIVLDIPALLTDIVRQIEIAVTHG